MRKSGKSPRIENKNFLEMLEKEIAHSEFLNNGKVLNKEQYELARERVLNNIKALNNQDVVNNPISNEISKVNKFINMSLVMQRQQQINFIKAKREKKKEAPFVNSFVLVMVLKT